MNNSNGSSAAAAGALGALVVIMLIGFAIAVLTIAGMWKTYSKAGKPGWAAIIPIYTHIIQLEIAGKPIWWIFLLFIPLVNVIIFIIMLASLAKNFGRGIGTTLGLIFFPMIFWPILGFGSAKYLAVPATT